MSIPGSDMDREPFAIELDEERQIIRQRIACELSVEQFRSMVEQTKVCSLRLRNPSNVRILIDGKNLGKAGSAMRKIGYREIRSDKLSRMAIFNAGIFTRTFARFLSVVSGGHKAAAFSTEAEAIEWLEKDGD